ncbi:hypothetical protein [Lacibacter sediminis]|uniref:Phosphoribosylpyrophosphate synthetase n=1 Tax=Lacibacter sediminis TaxID=2760713 RepID=A0A7G5XKA0_9BACT|nr:hypothetical protein [Lacibacter sediminis]QNA45903.1 hypothetical protein H4075_06845 [Lacibacter sediminis]
MKIYYTVKDAVCDLHEKGFTHDFQISGNDLLWVQQQCFVRTGDFSIKEYHQFRDRSEKGAGIIVFGVVALYHNVKGILIRHYSTKSFKTPPVLLKKMNDLINR